ncbi:TIR domain-containing protein [Haematococcus lacustris]|uniref:TIR domain-containing protein n=1 Tax=Haematococcus lacustris TaxID=44745 RepID=A0A6A0A6N1_HAELA|nr:TIR domain-containing protein [Haematococcus lacustris]
MPWTAFKGEGMSVAHDPGQDTSQEGACPQSAPSPTRAGQTKGQPCAGWCAAVPVLQGARDWQEEAWGELHAADEANKEILPLWHRELHAADEANKEILPLWHSGDYPPKPVSMYLTGVQRLPRGNQPLVQADFQSLVSDLEQLSRRWAGWLLVQEVLWATWVLLEAAAPPISHHPGWEVKQLGAPHCPSTSQAVRLSHRWCAAVLQAGCLPRNPPGPSNQALQGGPAQGGAQLFLSYRELHQADKANKEILPLWHRAWRWTRGASASSHGIGLLAMAGGCSAGGRAG